MIALDNLPGVAQVAIQGAKYAAKEIDNRLEGKPPQAPFKYFDKGSMAIISRFRAVAMVGKFRLTGIVAWLMWLGVHLVYLTGFKNQVSALMRWAITFISNNRSERTTTEQQIFARAALARLRRGAADLVSDPGIYDADPGDDGGDPAPGARGGRGPRGRAHRLRCARRARRPRRRRLASTPPSAAVVRSAAPAGEGDLGRSLGSRCPVARAPTRNAMRAMAAPRGRRRGSATRSRGWSPRSRRS